MHTNRCSHRKSKFFEQVLRVMALFVYIFAALQFFYQPVDGHVTQFNGSLWSCAVVAGQQWLDSDFDAEKKRLCSPQMLAAGYDALSRRVNDVFSKAYLEVKPISVDEKYEILCGSSMIAQSSLIYGKLNRIEKSLIKLELFQKSFIKYSYDVTEFRLQLCQKLNVLATGRSRSLKVYDPCQPSNLTAIDARDVDWSDRLAALNLQRRDISIIMNSLADGIGLSKTYPNVTAPANVTSSNSILEAAKEALIINDLAQNVTLRKLSEDVPLQGQRSEIIQLTSDIEGLEFEPKLRYEKDFVPCRKRAVANGCGTKYETRRFRRIVGGEDAEPGEWPWMVVINLSRPGFNETRLCGGSLISDRYVLTAGHCFHAALSQMGSVSLSSFTVKVGVVYWNSSVEPISIKAMHIAPLYDDDTLTDDLALVKLATPVVFNETVQPICLPERYEDFIGQLASVTGWGYTTPDAKDYNDILQQTQVEVLPQRSCASILDRQMDAIERRKGIICAGFEDGRSDACKGDSGGPLMVQTTCNQWLLIGVVSFGESCSVPDRPGLYVDVARYIDWIVANSDLGKRKLSASPAQEKPVLG
ncbi:transmembrane protease serine 11D [Hyalella azteca]|uniref:Transmembrane protease serine 11D n=1 Tax=Hyalella azteca TaxID=294128 RepID=A0A8B7MYV6_HYAAZ|nr:transmembrane protease serine 11D [Hyalella azteca]